MRRLKLERIPGDYTICKLPAGDDVPGWVAGDFVSISRTVDELSIVCAQSAVPADVPAERDWSCLRVAGKMEFSQVGVIAAITKPIAEANMGVFVVSTFDTDYVLVKGFDLENAITALRRAGHEVS